MQACARVATVVREQLARDVDVRYLTRGVDTGVGPTGNSQLNRLP
ncbi:hypothetical protein GCM10020255_065120 [Rhodococcus baikonurensis]